MVDWDDKTLGCYPTYTASKASRSLYHFTKTDSSLILHGENVAIVAEDISFLLPGIDYYQMQYIYNDRPLNYLDQCIMFLKTVCSLYHSIMTTISPNFQVFFRATMQFLLGEKGYPSAYVDFLLTLNWSKGNSPQTKRSRKSSR